MKNWPASRRQPVQAPAGHVAPTRRRRPSGDDRGDPQAVPQRCATAAAPTRQTRTAPAAATHSLHQKTVAAGRGEELLPGPQLVRQREADAEVGVEVQQVPGLVAQPAPGGPDAGDTTMTRQTVPATASSMPG